MADNALVRILTALLKHQVKKLVGEDALGVIGEELTAIGGDKLDEQVKTLLGAKSTAEELEKAAVSARDNFRGKINDDEIEQWIVMLPLDNLPTIVFALEELSTSPDESKLENALRETISLNWKKLSPEQVSNAVNSYLFCLRNALLPIEKQTLMVIGRSVLRTEEKVDLLIQKIEKIQSVDQPSTDHVKLNAKTAQELFGVSAALVEIEKIKPATQERLKSFYQGDLLWWDIIVANGDVERDSQKNILDNFASHPETIKMLCVVGEPGAGKSTLAWRVAGNISRSLAIPLIHLRDNESEDFWYLLENGTNQYGKPIVVLADDIFRDINATRALASINLNTPAIIISTSRSNEMPDDLLLHFDVDFIYLQRPTSNEIIRALEKANLQQTLNSDQLKKLTKATTWLVLMYEMTTGEKLSKRVHDSVKRLKNQDEIVYKAYEYICFAGQFDLKFPATLLHKLDDRGQFYEIYKRPTAKDLILQSGRLSNHLSSKHSIIAKFAYESYKRDPSFIAKEIFSKINYSDYVERFFLTAFMLSLLNNDLIALAKETLINIDMVSVLVNSSCSELILGWTRIYEMLNDFDQTLASKKMAYSKSIESVTDWNVMKQGYDIEPSYIPDFIQKALDWLKLELANSLVWVSTLRVIEKNGSKKQIEEAMYFTEHWLNNSPKEVAVREFYLGVLERKGTSKQIEEAIRFTEQWLNDNPKDVTIRKSYLGLLERKGTSEQIEEAIHLTGQWLNDNPKDVTVHAFYLGLLERKGTSEQIEETIRATEQWLKDNPKDITVREFYLGLLDRNGTSEQIEEAIRLTEQWLNDNPKDVTIRKSYLGLLERKGTSEQIEEAIRLTGQWLNDNPKDIEVRKVYLGLIERKGTSEQIEEAIRLAGQWLNDNPKDIEVRRVYLVLLERKGTSEQIGEALRLTGQWLNDNPKDANVRAFFLGILERKGTSERIGEALRLTGQWLSDNPKDIEVRRVYLGLLERKGTSEQIGEALRLTGQWLNDNPKDANVRVFFLGILERKGTFEQIEEAIRATEQWLNDNPKEVNVHEFYLGLLERKGTSEQIEEAIRLTEQWLNDNPKDVNVRRVYLGLLERKGTSEQIGQAIRATEQWLNDNPKDITVRRAYLGLMKRKGSPEQIGEVIRATYMWLKANTNDIEIRIIYLGLIEREGSREQIEEVVHSVNQWLKIANFHHKGSLASLHYEIGLLMLRLSQKDSAEEKFRQALEYHKGHVPARIGLSWCLYDKGRKKDALKELRSALWWSEKKRDYFRADVYFQMGSYWFRENNYGFAEDFFKKAVQFCDPSFNPYKYYIELGRTQVILKEDEAIKILQKAKELINIITVDKTVEADLDQLIEQALKSR